MNGPIIGLWPRGRGWGGNLEKRQLPSTEDRLWESLSHALSAGNTPVLGNEFSKGICAVYLSTTMRNYQL